MTVIENPVVFAVKRARTRRPRSPRFLMPVFPKPHISNHPEVVEWWRKFRRLEKKVLTSETGEMGLLSDQEQCWLNQLRATPALSKTNKKALIYIGVLELG